MSDLRVEPLQAWALVVAKKPRAGFDARIRGGDSRCNIFWTRAAAKRMQRLFPESVIVRVVVNQVPALAAAVRAGGVSDEQKK